MARAKVEVIGAGLAGLATTAALSEGGFEVDLFEARNFPGGRATSWQAGDEIIDNCQHVLLPCCVNLLDLYRRLGVQDKITFHREFFFIEPGGRTSTLKRGLLPFLKLNFLGIRDKIAIIRGLNSIRRERRTRRDLDRISMLDWLREKRQTAGAIERFWRQVLVSAVNEELDRMAAAHGFQVFWLGMIGQANAFGMGTPDVPLRELYEKNAAAGMHPKTAITSIEIRADSLIAIDSAEMRHTADFYVSCLPFERLQPLLPGLPIEWTAFEHSPITGIHLWFDRSVTDLPHAALLDRTIQWMFNKSEGRYIQAVVSASRSLVDMPRKEVIELTVRELGEFLPLVRQAELEKAQVIKEVRATFSARPGLEALRPGPATPLKNFFLAGDWTRSGWPATMEGAVRSGYIAAEAVAAAAGAPRRFLLPDIA